MNVCWQYDRSFAPEACNGLRAFIEAYSSEDALDQYDWHAEQRCPNLCTDFHQAQQAARGWAVTGGGDTGESKGL